MKKFWMLLLCLMMALMAGVAMADEVPAELLGEWDMISVDGTNVFPEGTTINMVFTETEVTMTISFYGVSEEQIMPYTVEGSTIVVNGVADEYKIEGDTLWLTETGITMVFTRAGAAPAADEGILGEWDIVEISGPAIDGEITQSLELIKAMGGTMTMKFTATEMIMRATIFGETIEEPMFSYTIEGNMIVVDGEGVPYVLNGNTLTIADEEACMVLQRVGTEAEPVETVTQPTVAWEEGSILGPWDVVEFLGDEEAAQSMELVKSMGGSVTVTFTETEMTLAMSFFGEAMEEITPYVIVDNTIVAEDGEPVAFVLDGNILTIGNAENGGMLLQRPDVPVETTEPAIQPVDDGSVIGEWVLVDMTGDEEMTEAWELMKLMGASIEMTITEDSVTMITTVFGESETESFGSTIEGNKLIDETGYALEFTLENGRLTLLEDGVGMVFERK